MTTWELLPPLGFSSTGFISAVGSIPAAFAWMACAIPISLPSRVIQELRLMFWALNGATLYFLESILHRAVTSMLLPAWELVPITMRFFVISILSYPLWLPVIAHLSGHPG